MASLPKPVRRASWPLRAIRLYQMLRPYRVAGSALEGLGGIRLLRRHAGISEFEAESDAGPLLILRVTRDDPGIVARNIHFAYENLMKEMRDHTGCDVLVPLDLIEPLGIVVLGRVEAPSLQDLIARGKATSLHLRRVGAWLAALHASFPVRPGGFDAMERMDETAYPYRRLRLGGGHPEPSIMDQIADSVEAMAPSFDGEIVDFVKFHKDIAPRSFYITADEVVARDVTNTRRRPRCYDLAHLLIEAGIDAGLGIARDKHGLPDGWYDACLAGYGQDGGGFQRAIHYAMWARMLDIYTSGYTTPKQSARFLRRRAVLLEMAAAIELEPIGDIRA
ncbi:hypothetical protein FHS89_001903 [Rubricella aquisinus]|uniref:Uncharacterized protein n=1 Tax=Rubricella aquisinus TaxID=2028108 RepID=A0A840WP77_9RHOB|nr:hypothetical protein [Rubricella aquisinus]MBB5515883.1 hypothetical protein [Rubricella aquisinus]